SCRECPFDITHSLWKLVEKLFSKQKIIWPVRQRRTARNLPTERDKLYGDSPEMFQELVCSFRIQAVEPFDFLMPPAQPGELALRQLPGGNYPALDHLLQRESPLEIVPGLPVPHSPDRRHRHIQIPPRMQGFHLGKEPLLHHLLEAQGNAFVENMPLTRSHSHIARSIGHIRPASRAAFGIFQRLATMPFAERHAGQQKH